MARWLALFLPALLFFTTPARAESFCNGADCAKINRSYSGYLNDLERSYLPVLTKDILIAQAMAGITSLPHHVSMDRFTVGTSFTAAITQPNQIPVYNEVTGKYRLMNEQGFAVQPNFYAGFNVGWLVNGLYSWMWCPAVSCEKDILPILNKFELYGFGVGNYKATAQDDFLGSRRTFGAVGGMVRYHMLKPFTWHGFLRLSGFTLGAAAYDSRQRVRLSFSESLNLDVTDTSGFEWQGRNKFEYYTDTKTTFMDARTGIKLLDAFAVYGGIGQSTTKGTAKVAYSRDGIIVTPATSTNYRLALQGTADETAVMKYGFIGASIGALSLQYTRSLDRNSLTNHDVYAGTIAFTFNF